MGFLRKVGRRIKKGVKKLFSSKIGSFIGSIGLSMMMGPIISRAFNGIKGVFTGTGATAGQAAAKATTQAATEAAKQATTSLATDAGTKLTTEQILSGETLQSVASKEVAGGYSKEALTDAFSNAIKSKDPLKFTETLTQGTASGTIPLNISDSVTGSLNNINNYIETGDMFTPEVSKAIKVNKQIMEAPKLFGDKKLGADIKENFKGVKEFASDPFGKTKEYLGEGFVPDAVQSIAKSSIESALTPEYEAPFQSKGVPNVGSNIESSYMREVKTQVPNMRATDFNQLNQSLFFGTLSPQFLAAQAREMQLAAPIPGR
jgi:hypothetical protein